MSILILFVWSLCQVNFLFLLHLVLFSGFVLFPCLECIPLAPHFASFFVLISIYYVGQLCLSVLERWSYVRDDLQGSAVCFPLVTSSKCSRSDPCVGFVCPSVAAGLFYLQVPGEARLSPWLAGCHTQLRVAAIDPSDTLLGVGSPSTGGCQV